MNCNLFIANFTGSLVLLVYVIDSLTPTFGDVGNKTILVTSSVSGEGKTFVSINMATVFAVSGKKTILDFILKPILKVKQDSLHER